MNGQIEKIKINIRDLCPTSVSEIIKKNKKVRHQVLPDEFVVDSINYKIDSSYIFIGKRKFLEQICFSDKFKLRIRNSVDKLKNVIYVQDLVSNKKGKIEFVKFCDIKFIGVKIIANRFSTLYFEAIYQDQKDFFSVNFSEELMILNFDLPKYIKCD